MRLIVRSSFLDLLGHLGGLNRLHIVSKVAVSAHLLGVICLVLVDAIRREVFSTLCVVAMITHTLGIMRQVCVRTIRNLPFFTISFSFWFFAGVGLWLVFILLDLLICLVIRIQKILYRKVVRRLVILKYFSVRTFLTTKMVV